MSSVKYISYIPTYIYLLNSKISINTNEAITMKSLLQCSQNMKFVLLSLISLYWLLGNEAYSQTILYSEDFEGGNSFSLNVGDMGSSPAGDNLWVVNNTFIGGSGSGLCLGAIPFNFTVPNSPLQPVGILNQPTSTYMHITSQVALTAGLACASWIVPDGLCFNPGTYMTKMSNDISTIGSDSVEFNFWWMCGGDAVEYGQVYYSTNSGSTWTIINHPLGGTQFSNQLNWVNMSLSDPAWAQQSTLRFAFRFVTAQSTTPLEPSFAIDDITVIGHSCTPSNGSIVTSVCDSYTVPSGDETYTLSGLYMDTIPNAFGCDSIISIDVTINSADNSASQVGAVLTAGASGATYQWLDCDNGFSVIGGATNQSFTASSNGSYAVQVNQGGCTDTSACLTVAGLGLEMNPLFSDVRVFPNPTSGELTIEFEQLKDKGIKVYNVLGELVFSKSNIVEEQFKFTLKEAPGLYILEIQSKEEVQQYRIVKE